MGLPIEPLSRSWEGPDGGEVYVRAFLGALRTDEVQTVSDWADRNRVLSRKATAEHGQWRTSRTPYLREIMDTLSPSHPASEVTFVKGTQIGGSECGYNWLGAIIDLWPAPTMLVMPTTDTAKRISKQRLAPMIEETPALCGKVAENRKRDSGNTVLMKDFPGGTLVITGANSGPGLRSMPVRFLFEDEVDAYPEDVGGEGDPCVVAEKRTETYSRRKIFRCSSPKLKATSRIERYYEASDQRRYHVPCPHCRHAQYLRWEQMRWETRRVWEVTDPATGDVTIADADAPGAVERDTGEVIDYYYQCESCDGRIDEHHKTAMLAAGQWIEMCPGAGRHPGFHLSALYSPLGWFSWRQAVEQYLGALKDPSGELMQVFYNTVLGQAWEEQAEQVDESELKSHVEDYRIGGPVPARVAMLTCGVDVQHDRLEARLWGWAEGEESWLIAREIIYGPFADEDTWTALDAWLQQEWTTEDGKTLRIMATAIDASDGNSTHYVREFCRHRVGRHVLAVKGQAAPGRPIIGKPTRQDVSHKGKLYKDAVQLWQLGSDTAKALIYARYKITEPGPQYVHLPSGLPEEEFAQMTAEKVITRYVKGFPKREWVKNRNARNEALDCYVMALAAAHYAGITRANWRKVRSGGVKKETAAQPAETPAVVPEKKQKPAKLWPYRGGNFATSWGR